jgi:ABC-type amino acid transport substrate-binding protein
MGAFTASAVRAIARAGATVLALAAVDGLATPSSVDARDALVVGIKQAPPFVIKTDDGRWRGISVDLWRAAAEQLGLRYEFMETDLEGLLEAVESSRFDAGIGALTVTAEREKRVDFSHPFHASGLGIAVAESGGSGIRAIVARLLSRQFLFALGSLVLFLFIGGALLWLFERRKNAAEFGESPSKGLGNAFWWSAVTMTTVGYGDKVPRTLGGRIVGVVWMFTGVITISFFTASIASVLTLSSIDGRVTGPEDLADARIASVPGSTSARYLEARGLGFARFDGPRAALHAVAEGTCDAVVYDAPILRYLVAQELSADLDVLAVTFEPQEYAIALPRGSALREPLNVAILEVTRALSWEDTLRGYFGG